MAGYYEVCIYSSHSTDVKNCLTEGSEDDCAAACPLVHQACLREGVQCCKLGEAWLVHEKPAALE